MADYSNKLLIHLLALLAVLTMSAAEISAAKRSLPTGTRAVMHQLTFSVSGSSCLSCIRRIERTIRKTAGVESVDVLQRYPVQVTVIYDPQKVTIARITSFAPKEGVEVSKLKDRPAAKK